MFRLLKMEMVHWDYWQRVTVPLDASIVTIVGPNGSGKTTLLDALRTLFALDCSKKRDYRRYARKNDEEFCWLRGVVDNTRSPSGKHPFFPILKDAVTLACRIEKNKGEWLRQYCIAEGEQEIDALNENAAWMGVREFQRRLHEAGLTPAIAQVLSLEQGQTDKLCEKSPRDLLNLVFEVFGDKPTLERYREAKEHQEATARELGEFERQLEKLGYQIERTKERVNLFHQWRDLNNERNRLFSEVKPRVELHQLRESIRGARGQITGSRREHRRQGEKIRRIVLELPELEHAINMAGDKYNSHKTLENEAIARLNALNKELGALESTLKRRDRLQQLAAQGNSPETGSAARQLGEAETEHAEIRAALKAKTDEQEQTRQLLNLLEAGRRADPQDVADMRGALDEARIAHDLLPEIVEIADESWQPALESMLAPFRHVILLRHEKDRGEAYVIGEKRRYRHFIVPEHIEPPSPTPGSLLEAVRFTRPAPAWLIQLLDRTQRVENAEEGKRQPRGQDWVTRDGYLSERRGGRHAGVRPADFAFGRARLAALRQTLGEQEDTIGRLNTRKEELAAVIERCKAQLMGLDAARQLALLAEEFSRAEAEHPEAEQRAALQKEELAQWQKASEAANLALTAARQAHEGAARDLEQLKKQQEKLENELRTTRQDQVGRIQRLRHDRAKLPPAWRDQAANEALAAEYESASTVEREIVRLERRLAEGQWEKDETVEALLEKYRQDFQAQEAEQQRRQRENERARQITENAREAYIDVLRATVRNYAKNLRALGDIAGVKVEAQMPVLAADDVTLAQAALEVKFDFDSKGFMGLNDGDASGGQQVMKSLILLIALMMEDSRPGGFVFIDEPFAHLDIFNIDRVAGFLKATKAQYLITTPITHNVNVYDPSLLTLVTFKKRPGEPWAPRIGKLVRDARD